MKKNLLSILALGLAVVNLLAAVYALIALGNAKNYYKDRLFELNQQITALEEENEALSGRIAVLEAKNGAWEWTLEATPWDDRTGAEIVLHAIPEAIQQGTEATLIVRREGQEILRTPCTWETNAFRATASLSAADGYGYYLLLTCPGGDTQELAISTPDDPLWDIPVNLAQNLTASCVLVVNSWEQQENTLVLSSAHAAVVLPRLLAEADSVTGARLILNHNGTEADRVSITLEPSEVAGSFDKTLSDIRFTLPETQPDDVLELHLEVELSSGQILTLYSTSWYLNGEELYAVVG